MKILMIGIYLLLSASGLICFKLGSSRTALITLIVHNAQMKLSTFSLVGILFYGCSFLLYLGLVSKYDLSYIVPVTTGIMYIIIFISSYIIFKEPITLVHVIGTILVLIGITMINL